MRRRTEEIDEKVGGRAIATRRRLRGEVAPANTFRPVRLHRGVVVFQHTGGRSGREKKPKRQTKKKKFARIQQRRTHTRNDDSDDNDDWGGGGA